MAARLSVEPLSHVEAESDRIADSHGWQTVKYAKRQRKHAKVHVSDQEKIRANGAAEVPNIYRDLEEHAEQRRRALQTQKVAAEEVLLEHKPAPPSDEDSEAEIAPSSRENEMDIRKTKPKKPKKPKVTVQEASSKIDASDLSAHLLDISTSYKGKPDIQLMRFADYFGRAFSAVSASQFPWTKLFRESTVAKIVDIPMCYISEAVYRTAVDWIGQHSAETLSSFVLWALDRIFEDLANHLGNIKVSKKSSQHASSKSQVAVFVALAMILRRKPDALIYQLPTLRDNLKYQGQEKLPILIWTIAQASHGDLVIGLYACVHNLLPVVTGKSGCNTQSRDLALQLVERICTAPKARSILLNGAVRKGERVVPPSSIELLLRVTFPAPSVRVRLTERFEAVYPILKEVALAGAPGSKSIKQVSQQFVPITVKAMCENNPELSKEAAEIFIWCLAQNNDCYKQWEKLHLANIEASVTVLRKFAAEWKHHAVALRTIDTLRGTLETLRQMNEQALSGGMDTVLHSSFREADKYCKYIIGRTKRGFTCVKSGVFVLMLAVAVYAVILSPNMESWNWKKIYVMLTATQTF